MSPTTSVRPRYASPMRHLLVVPCAAWIAACYSPNDEVTTGGADDSEASGSGSTAGMTASSATTTPADTSGDTPADTGDTTDDPTGDTGEDAPPVIESFSVQGSLLPSEILMADTVVLAADVVDDVGVARVEFYDGGTLVATVDGAPWRTEFLVTSADNGGHSYTAVAYDTAEQTAEAGPIPLSVSIDGGAVIELREEVFRSRTGLGVFSAPAVSVTSGGDVIVFGSSRFSGQNFSGARWTTIRYSDTLSELWQRDFPSQVSAGTPDHWSISAPVESDGEVLIVEYTSDDTNSVHPMNAETGALGTALELSAAGPDSAPPLRSLAIDADLNLLVLTVEGDIQKLDPVGNVVWTEDVMTGLPDNSYPVRITADANGNAFVDILSAQAGSNESSLRKFSPDGALQWTRDNAGVSQPLPDGSVVTLGGWFGDALTLLHRDPDGTELAANELDVQPFTGMDAALTPSGDVVFVGFRQAGVPLVFQAWALRTTADGEMPWVTQLEVGTQGKTLASGVAVTTAGRLYVTGTADDEAEAYPDNFTSAADAWVAELAL